MTKIIQDTLNKYPGFTQEQKDYICYVIGDWYFAWRDEIIESYENKTHHLGYAKETLKRMICDGEGVRGRPLMLDEILKVLEVESDDDKPQESPNV